MFSNSRHLHFLTYIELSSSVTLPRTACVTQPAPLYTQIDQLMLFLIWHLLSRGIQAPFSMPAGSCSGVGFPRPQESTVYNIPTVVATEWLALFLFFPLLFNWGFFLPMLLSGSGLGSCPMDAGSFCKEGDVGGGGGGGGPHIPSIPTPNHSPSNPYHPWQLRSFVPHPTHSLLTHCHRIFSVVENPSHE